MANHVPLYAFRDVDIPLKDDVRMLGEILGQVIREEAGDALFELVENLRLGARSWRAGDAGAIARLEAATAGLPTEVASELTRAFSEYFGVVNMAEQVHRIRRRRQRAVEETGPQPGSLEAVLQSLASRGVSWETVRHTLQNLRVIPVFTAHPTRAIRRSLLAKEQRVARALVERMQFSQLIPVEQAATVARIRSEIASAWQTEENVGVRPTVSDEAEYVLFYLTHVVYRVVPPFYQALREAVRSAYGDEAAAHTLPTILRFGSWVGGDMDGNPNVTAETLTATLAQHRSLILRRYRDEVRGLSEELSQSTTRVEVAAPVLERVASYRQLLPEAAKQIPERYAHMPYRALLLLMAARLQKTLEGASEGYPGAGALEADVLTMLDSMRAHRGMDAGGHLLQRLLWRIQTFGFHLATLDIRQDALVHREAVAQLLGIDDFGQKTSSERTKLITDALALERVPQRGDGDALRRTLDVFRAIRRGGDEQGARAIGPFIISMAQGPDDALAVLLLARAAGLGDAARNVPLDIAPLFETVDDLQAAAQVMDSLFAHATYRRHLNTRGGDQLVMLGYSDSSKDGGIAASRWALQLAQTQLLANAAHAGVSVLFFHGRGGTAGRGGSKPRDAILAEPAGAVRRCLRVTEQGEIIHAKYGLRGIALRTLELMSGATLEASATPEQAHAVDTASSAAMHTIAAESRRAYRALMHEDPHLFSYFRDATPIDVIERMHIGSRPSSRRAQRGIQDLRAIPWVFAWTQSRHMLPGWYGVGAGLEAAATTSGLDTLRAMRSTWPFFANLLSDVEMVLAKTDLTVARRYADLAGDIGNIVFPIIQQEHERTLRWLLEVLERDRLLADDAVIRRNLQLRNPYVDPISLLQVDLLNRWRATDRQDTALERALFSTVRGIARAMQNTG